MKTPIGRTTRQSFYSPGGETPQVLHGTWLEAEAFAYPNDTFTRRAYVELRQNPHNPIDLPYGRRFVVRCKVADTFSTIPARLTIAGRTVRGFISVTTENHDDETARFTFTPEAAGD